MLHVNNFGGRFEVSCLLSSWHGKGRRSSRQVGGGEGSIEEEGGFIRGGGGDMQLGRELNIFFGVSNSHQDDHIFREMIK